MMRQAEVCKRGVQLDWTWHCHHNHSGGNSLGGNLGSPRGLAVFIISCSLQGGKSWVA